MDTVSHVRSFFQQYPDIDDEETRRVVLEVNRLMDVLGAGPEGHIHRWRRFLHHREGVGYFRAVYGKLGETVAWQHVLDDCGSVPSAIDYYNGILDENGVEQ